MVRNNENYENAGRMKNEENAKKTRTNKSEMKSVDKNMILRQAVKHHMK